MTRGDGIGEGLEEEAEENDANAIELLDNDDAELG